MEAESKNRDGAIQNFLRRIAKKQQGRTERGAGAEKAKTPNEWIMRFIYGARVMFFWCLAILVIPGRRWSATIIAWKDMEDDALQGDGT
ncbi:MAG: hypothetical protein ACLTTO_10385 [Lachnospiraceae bacterium]